MKILLVFDCNTEIINGASQSVANLYYGLSALGQDVRLLCPEGSGEEKGFFTRVHDFSFAYPGLKMSVFISKQVLKEIVAWGPDIVHSNSEGALCWWSDVICRRTGARHIHTFHTNFLDFYGDYFLFVKSFLNVAMPLWMKLRARRLDAVIFPSEWGRQVFKRLNLKAPEYVIPNGIHTEIFGADDCSSREKIRSLYGISDNDVLLMFTGRVAAEKNIPELLKLFGRLRGNFKLMIVGGGPALEDIKKGVKGTGTLTRAGRGVNVKGTGTLTHDVEFGEARKNATGDVIFTDMVPPCRMSGFYSAADIFVTASLSEIQPLTYVEAMASKLPVVCAYAHYVDGLIINGETGYAFNNPEEFIQYVEQLSGNPSLRCKVGECARERVREEYSVETFARRCMEVYEKTKND